MYYAINYWIIRCLKQEKGLEILSSGFEYIPQVTKKLSPEQQAEVEKLLEKMEEDEDVQNVYHTMDTSE